MKICVVVCNSIWFDPRVNKQIESYLRNNEVELSCVGVKCNRYNAEKINQLKCPVSIVEVPEIYRKKLSSPISKLKRERAINHLISSEIIKQNPDIIHANDLDALIPSMIAAKKLRCKIVYDSHEIYLENPYILNNKMYYTYLSYCEKKCIKKSDIMICVSNAAADYFSRRYKISKPLVITNCISREAKYDKLPKCECFEVLNQGIFTESRGYDILAQTCKYISAYPDIRLAVRGFGKIEEELHSIISNMENKDQFIFYPSADVKDMIPLASKSSVGIAITEPICINFKLSVSNKLFEYAAAGLPVIMSDIPEHRYLNEMHNIGIILPQCTAMELGKAIIRLYKDKRLYEELSQNALKLSEKINWEGEFEKLMQLEKKLINKDRLSDII